ncbi:MAG: hypothetical protein LLF95_11235 [Bacteroidales bacterium]|nr:hypothetical protein [Bacteroidales bacterium]
MNKTHLYLLKRFSQTKWPYYGPVETKFYIGESFNSDIKELREKKMIEPCAGLNGLLIKILDFESKWN